MRHLTPTPRRLPLRFLSLVAGVGGFGVPLTRLGLGNAGTDPVVAGIGDRLLTTHHASDATLRGGGGW